jgi:deoxyhypusine synthase
MVSLRAWGPGLFLQNRMVDVVCTTAGGIEEDLIKVRVKNVRKGELGAKVDEAWC